MKTKSATIILIICTLAGGCGRQPGPVRKAPEARPIRPVDPLAVALAPHQGTSGLDEQIRQAQQRARRDQGLVLPLEQLGWMFVAKARQTFDPGFYTLAEQCALGIEFRHPHQAEALWLRGHALQNLHRFKEAEPLARELVSARGRAFDYGLLGDVLMELGRLDDAISAYQTMADLKPDVHAYTRGAHVRWLKGDLDGAIEMLQLAIPALGPRNAETAAWVNSRMALYQFQAGHFDQAGRQCDAALEFQPEYPPALLLRGRLFLAQGKNGDAANAVQRAAKLNPVPEYQWLAVEAGRASGRDCPAEEAFLRQCGAAVDPRTFALFLATQGTDSSTALRLAREELGTRADIFSHDALAWALAAAGQWDEAGSEMALALAHGTRDARLFLHAAVIAGESGRASEAARWILEARRIRHMLLPSEQERLTACASKFLPQLSAAQ